MSKQRTVNVRDIWSIRYTFDEIIIETTNTLYRLHIDEIDCDWLADALWERIDMAQKKLDTYKERLRGEI